MKVQRALLSRHVGRFVGLCRENIARSIDSSKVNTISVDKSAPHGSGNTSTITREEILARLQDPSVALVNVMPKETFDAGHIPRSVNLPASQIEDKVRQLFPDLTRELIVYCAGPT